jgi:DnaJ-class molecular chaperone
MKYIAIIALLAVSAVAVYAAGVYTDMPCSYCKGSGTKEFNGHQQIPCNQCRGTGRRAN